MKKPIRFASLAMIAALGAGLEGQRRLRRLFWTDTGYYSLALGALVVWRTAARAPTATLVQWTQAAAAGLGSLVALASAWPLVAARPTRAIARRLWGLGTTAFATGLGGYARPPDGAAR